MPVDPKTVELVDLLWNDPETHDAVAALIEQKAPGAIERTKQGKLLESVRAERTAMHTEHEKLRKEIADGQAKADLHAARQALVDKGLATWDEIPEIERVMATELIGTHEAAARFYRATQIVATPRAAASGRHVLPGVDGAGGDEYKGLFTRDPSARDRWAHDRALEILDEFARDRAGATRKYMPETLRAG